MTALAYRHASRRRRAGPKTHARGVLEYLKHVAICRQYFASSRLAATRQSAFDAPAPIDISRHFSAETQQYL